VRQTFPNFTYSARPRLTARRPCVCRPHGVAGPAHHVQRLGRITQDVQEERPERALPRTRTRCRTIRGSGRRRLAPPDVVRLGGGAVSPSRSSRPLRTGRGGASSSSGGSFARGAVSSRRSPVPCGPAAEGVFPSGGSFARGAVSRARVPVPADRPRRGVFLKRKIPRSTRWSRGRVFANEKVSCLRRA